MGAWQVHIFLPRHSFSSVVFDGQFYVMGGWTGDGNTNTVEVWDPGNLLWAKKLKMPRLLSDATATVVGNIAIVTGGRIGNTDRVEHVTTEVWPFNPISASWTPLPPMPFPREHHVQQVVDGILIAADGENQEGPVLEMWLYDIKSQTWSVAARLPKPRIEAAMALWNRTSYLFGGHAGEPHREILTYSLESDLWMNVGEMPVARFGFGIVSASDGIHILGDKASP